MQHTYSDADTRATLITWVAHPVFYHLQLCTPFSILIHEEVYLFGTAQYIDSFNIQTIQLREWIEAVSLTLEYPQDGMRWLLLRSLCWRMIEQLGGIGGLSILGCVTFDACIRIAIVSSRWQPWEKDWRPLVGRQIFNWWDLLSNSSLTKWDLSAILASQNINFVRLYHPSQSFYLILVVNNDLRKWSQCVQINSG